MPVIAIKPHYEMLSTIPEGSYVELEDGRRILFLEVVSVVGEQHARFKEQDGTQGSCPVSVTAKYICSIVDFEAVACVS